MKQKIAIILCLALVLVLGLTLVACNKDSEKEATAQSFVSLDINPEINLTLDKNNKVISVSGANEDGQVLLYGEKGIIGVDVETAVGNIVNLAIKYGYLDENNTVVGTSVSSSIGNADKILAKVNAKIEATKDEDGKLTIKADASGSFALLREYENFKANHANVDISIADFKLALAASETGEVTLEVAVTLDTSKLIKIVNDAQKKAAEYATEAYDDAVEMANAVYEQALKAADSAAYIEFYGKRIAKIATNLDYANTVYYGGLYGMYASTSAGLKVTSAGIKAANKVATYALDEVQIKKIATALGFTDEDVNKLKDSSGNITIESIEAYANKYFKNSEQTQEIKAKAEALKKALNDIQIDIRIEIDGKVKEYSLNIEKVVKAGEDAVTALNNTLASVKSLLPEEFQTYLDDFAVAAAKVRAVLKGEEGAMDNLDEYIKELDAKADEILGKIKQDMTEKDKQELQEIKDRNAKTLSDAKAKFDKSLSDAKNEAMKFLQEKKDARRPTPIEG